MNPPVPWRQLATAGLLALALLPGVGCGDDGVTVKTGPQTTPTATAPAVLTGDFTVMTASADAVGVTADGPSGGTSISGDGDYVAFASSAGNLVPGDTNGAQDVFLKEVASGAITRVSTGASGAQADAPSGTSTTSGDGRYVAFWSEAANLTASDTNGLKDVFVKDSLTDTTAAVSVDTAGDYGDAASDMPSISDDGRFVAFRSAAGNLVPGDTNGALDIFVRDMATGTTKIASADAAGAPGNADSCDTYPPSISADGRYVVFESGASNLVGGDTNDRRDIFVKDMMTGEVMLASAGAGGPGDGGSLYATISDNDRFVLFRSIAGNLVPGDTRICNGVNCSDVFLKDMETGPIAKVSTDAGGGDADAACWDPALSGDGRYATFSSAATNLVAGNANGDYDVFVKDVASGAIYLVSRTPAGEAASGWSIGPYLSADGLRIAFQSVAADLVTGDDNGEADVFLADGAPPA